MFYVENPLDKLKGLHTVRRLKFLGRGIVCFINVSKANAATCYDINVICSINKRYCCTCDLLIYDCDRCVKSISVNVL